MAIGRSEAEGSLLVPLFSAERIAISKATGSSSGLTGRRSEVRKLNMSGGDLTPLYPSVLADPVLLN